MRDMAANESLIISRNELDFQEGDNDYRGFDHDDRYMVDCQPNIKKGIFSMIDNVLGGAQSKNISMISNSYS
jgi:hypothetical protein